MSKTNRGVKDSSNDNDETKPDNPRTPQHVQVDKLDTTSHQYKEENRRGTARSYENMDDVIYLVKVRYETLQRILDRSGQNLTDKRCSDALSKLQILSNTYGEGLANLLLGKCYCHLLQCEYLEVYYYATELKSIATNLSRKAMLHEANSLLSKSYVLKTLDTENKQVQNHILKTYGSIIEDNVLFLTKLGGNELEMQEYLLLRVLYRFNVERCDFQRTLDVANRLLEIAFKYQDKERIIHMLCEFGKLYLLLGKYNLSYDIMKELLPLKIKDIHTKAVLVCNFSVVELLLGHKIHSLEHAKESFDLALQTEETAYIACAHGNIGLALEYMGKYDEAIEPYQHCLQIGEETENHRIISNGLCNLGRAHQGLGQIKEAKEYFKRAACAKRPPKAYWCDTEDFRFSGDYLLAKLAIKEENWEEARKQLISVIERCETLRKRIEDSPIKITFNETQRKPFQCLQHVLCEEGKVMEALDVAEKGRGRDFFDKIDNEICEELNSQELLMYMISSQDIAVLFISTLEEVGKLCFWFFSSKGELLKHWSIRDLECNEVLTHLCVALYETQGRHQIEFKGTTNGQFSLIEKTIELLKRDLPRDSEQDLQANSNSSLVGKNVKTTRASKENDNIGNTEKESSETKHLLSDTINKLSEMLLDPFKKELMDCIAKQANNEVLRLLIVPQGKTFNIPFSALKLNGKRLCEQVTVIEAFSLNSFAHSTTESEKKTATVDFGRSLIVGNPTNSSPNLPYAEEEAIAIAKLLGVIPLLRRQATKTAVIKQLPNSRLIHFACHGEMDGKALVLAHERHFSDRDCCITADEVEDMKLDADLVVLSACHTARGKINSEGVIGLARAFQIAGARTVVTALWAIPDGATKCFMELFYGHLCSGHPVADAIRETQITMLESKEFNEVINWGSFKVFGANAKIM